MLLKILKWFQGYLYVQICGYSPERFINLCSSKNILIWDIRRTESGYAFYITVKGFKSIRTIVKKTRTRPIIIKKIGFPFLLHRYRKRKIFAFGIVIFCFILYLLSLFIWDISISGGYTHTPEHLLKYLKSNEVYSGVLKKNIRCSEIEEAIRKEYNDIGWVSAQIKGTRLIIKVVETKMPESSSKRSDPCHIVATKDGIVKSIITRNGKPLIKVGSVVKKGDILVSGIIDIVSDDATVINKEAAVSDADIKLKTFYEYRDEFDLNYIDKEYTGNVKKSFSVSIFNHKIILYKPFKKYDKYDIIEDEKNLVIGNNFYLPLQYHIANYKEFIHVKKKYSKEEAIAIEKNKLELYISKLVEKGVSIIQNNVKITIDNNTCKASGKIIVEESAVDYVNIKDNEWRNLDTDEYSGDIN